MHTLSKKVWDILVAKLTLISTRFFFEEGSSMASPSSKCDKMLIMVAMTAVGYLIIRGRPPVQQLCDVQSRQP